MTWMLTASGKYFDLTLADPTCVDIDDIAHSLAQINRFNGHASRPYSVAEHSLHVSHIVETCLGITHPSALLAALLHDAHEAYTGDMTTPIKQALGSAWDAFEHHLQREVASQLGIGVANVRFRQQIKRADLIALATERRDLMPDDGTRWPCLHGIEPVTSLCLTSSTFTWADWRDAFLARFDELLFARNQLAQAGHPYAA